MDAMRALPPPEERRGDHPATRRSRRLVPLRWSIAKPASGRRWNRPDPRHASGRSRESGTGKPENREDPFNRLLTGDSCKRKGEAMIDSFSFRKMTLFFLTSPLRLQWRRLFLYGLFAALSQNCWPGSDYYLEIDKSKRELRLKLGKNTVRKYRIALGRGGVGAKRFLGDRKSPTGLYRIIGINERSRFHLFLHLDYPNIMDAWEGYQDALISERDLVHIAKSIKRGDIPPQNTPLGGYIGIHGLGQANAVATFHNLSNWTDGCIALTNKEIDELHRYVKIGTEVLVLE